MSFKLIDTDRDGRVLRQTFVRELGSAGCLVLVSTTVYQVTDIPVPPGHPVGQQQLSLAEMTSSVPIVSITESLAYVPGVKIGQDGLVPFATLNTPIVPSVPDDDE